MRCITHTTSDSFGGRYITLWQPLAGPIVSDSPKWCLDEYAYTPPPGYDDPTNAVIARWSPADIGDGRIGIDRKADVARDLYRLTGERVQRLDRFPAQSFDRRVALVQVVDVTRDHKKLACPPYSRLDSILGPVPVEPLSNDCGESDDTAQS